MKKTWFVLPGYCVGLGGLLLITYRTLLAVSSPEKAIMVSVNRFGEAYLDLLALVFLWVVCLVGLLCLSSLSKEIQRKDEAQTEQSEKGVLISSVFSFDLPDSFHQRSVMTLIGDADEWFYSADTASLSVQETENRVSISVVVQQGDS